MDTDFLEDLNPKITLRFFYEQVFASTISNMLGIIIGHPLDTIKVKIVDNFNSIGENANGSYLIIRYEMS